MLGLCRLVEGSNLSKHIPTESQESPANEAWMLQVAAQLVDVSIQCFLFKLARYTTTPMTAQHSHNLSCVKCVIVSLAGYATVY